MSRFERSLPPNQFPRNIASRAERLGLRGNVETPGLAILPPLTNEAVRAEQVTRLLLNTGRTADETTELARNIAREKAREAEKSKNSVCGCISLFSSENNTRRICSPIAVPPGSRESRTSNP